MSYYRDNYITSVDSGVSATKWDFSDQINNLKKEEIKEESILLIEALMRLFSSHILIGCKEMAR